MTLHDYEMWTIAPPIVCPQKTADRELQSDLEKLLAQVCAGDAAGRPTPYSALHGQQMRPTVPCQTGVHMRECRMVAGKGQVAWDVACFGELVMDLVPHSKSGEEWLYAPSPGGAPGNVAVGLARLGRRVVMLGKVGDEGFGNMIVSALDRYGVDTSGVTRAACEKTGLSVVTLGCNGEREFIFYRDNAADLAIDMDDVNAELIEHATISHFGVLPISAPRSAAAQRKAISLAKAAGRLVSVDPNFRPALWQDPDAMLFAARELIAQADIVKLSEDELFGLTDMSSIEEAVRSLWHKRLKTVAVTKGRHGAELFTA